MMIRGIEKLKYRVSLSKLTIEFNKSSVSFEYEKV